MKYDFLPAIRTRADGSIDFEAYDSIARKARAEAAKSIFKTVFQSVR